MKTTRAPTFTPKLIAAAHEAGERGMGLDELMAQPWAPKLRQQLNAACNRQVAKGFIFGACKGAKRNDLLRFFGREDHAKAWQDLHGALVNAKAQPRARSANAVVKPNDKAFSEMLHKRRLAEHSKAETKASAWARMEAIETAETTKEVRPTPPSRFVVTELPAGGLSSLKPGQYQDAPGSCAARAVL